MGSGCKCPRFLDLDTSWRWVASFTPRQLYPRGKSSGTHWIGGWVDPRAGLDDMEKLKKFLTLPGLKLRPLGLPARSAVAIPTALPRLPNNPPPPCKQAQCQLKWNKVIWDNIHLRTKVVRKTRGYTRRENSVRLGYFWETGVMCNTANRDKEAVLLSNYPSWKHHIKCSKASKQTEKFMTLRSKLLGLSPRANYTDRRDCRLSAKLMPIFAVSRRQRNGSLRSYSHFYEFVLKKK
jgi:hypothetical protein